MLVKSRFLRFVMPHDFAMREGSSNIRIAMMDSDENDAYRTQWTKHLAEFILCASMRTIPLQT